MSSTYLGSRIDDIDAQMDRISRLIDSAGRIDPELAAGLGCSASLASIQTRIDTALANTESLLKAVRAEAKKK